MISSSRATSTTRADVMRRESVSFSRAAAIAATKSRTLAEPSRFRASTPTRPAGPALIRSAREILLSPTRTCSSDGYAQDDIRLARSLSLSVGLRQELQTHLDDRLNLGPAGGRNLVTLQERRHDASAAALGSSTTGTTPRRTSRRYAWTASIRWTGPSSTPAILIRPPAAAPACCRPAASCRLQTWCSRRSRGRTWRSSRPWASTRAVNVLYGYASQPHRAARPRRQRAPRKWRAARSVVRNGHADRVDGAIVRAHAAHRAQSEPPVASHVPVLQLHARTRDERVGQPLQPPGRQSESAR